MCDCIDKISTDVLKHVTESHAAKGETVLKPNSWNNEGMLNTAFALITKSEPREIAGTQLRTHFVYRYTFEKKDKTTSKPKVMNVALQFNFCPFCGQPYSKPKGSIKVSDIYTQAISDFCKEVCDIEKPVLALLKAINDLNKTTYTGVLFQGRLAYGKDKKNSISWHDFMNSFVPSPFKLEI